MSKELALNYSEHNFTPSGLNLELDNFINDSKDKIKDRAQKAYLSVMDGEADPIDALIFIKKGSELFKELDAKIRPVAESKSIGKEYTKYGVKITEGMNGVKYDFSGCGDIEYEKLNEIFESAKEALEIKKTFLKSVTKDIELVDVETGESYTVHAPVKSGKLGFTLTIK